VVEPLRDRAEGREEGSVYSVVWVSFSDQNILELNSAGSWAIL
jgi:hypothetical protein